MAEERVPLEIRRAEPEDAAELVPYVFGHRLMLSSRARLNDYTPEAILAQVLEETPAPAMTERTL